MYKVVILAMILSITSVMAQDASTKYLQSKLTVEVESQVIASYNEWEQYLSTSFRTGHGNITMKESRKWKSYQGGFKISESEFFSSAGLFKQAQAAKSYASTNSMLTWGGALAVVGGCVLMGIGSDWYSAEKEDINMAIAIPGLVLDVGGIIMMLARVGRPDKKFPVSFAVEVADEYNSKLRESLE